MRYFRQVIRGAICAGMMVASVLIVSSGVAVAQSMPQSRSAVVNGVKLNYLIAGEGDPVVLLHGYAETSHMWRPLFPGLALGRVSSRPEVPLLCIRRLPRWSGRFVLKYG